MHKIVCFFVVILDQMCVRGAVHAYDLALISNLLSKCYVHLGPLRGRMHVGI